MRIVAEVAVRLRHSPKLRREASTIALSTRLCPATRDGQHGTGDTNTSLCSKGSMQEETYTGQSMERPRDARSGDPHAPIQYNRLLVANRKQFALLHSMLCEWRPHRPFRTGARSTASSRAKRAMETSTGPNRTHRLSLSHRTTGPVCQCGRTYPKSGPLSKAWQGGGRRGRASCNGDVSGWSWRRGGLTRLTNSSK